MKKLIVPFILISSLAACSTVPTKTNEREPSIVVVHKLVEKKIPGELLEIPDYPMNPGADADQKDIAIWLLENEKRVKALESQLKAIKDLNDKPVEEATVPVPQPANVTNSK